MAAYLLTVIGIPVYLHYCGGELEKVDYVVQSNGCCDEQDPCEPKPDCCEDEGVYLHNYQDFRLTDSEHFKAVKFFTQLSFLHLPFSISYAGPQEKTSLAPSFQPPGSVERSIRITVLRI